MDLRRLLVDRPLGLAAEESSRADAAARFAARARRYAMRLSRRIGLAGVALIVGLWAVLIWSTRAERQANIDGARAEGRNLAAAFAEEVSQTLERVDGTMQAIITRVQSGTPAGPSHAVLDHFGLDQWNALLPLIGYPAIRADLVSPDGTPVATTARPDSGPANPGARAALRAQLSESHDSLFIGVPAALWPGGRAELPVSRVVTGQDGRLLGALVLSLQADGLMAMDDSVDLGAGGVVALLGLDGAIRARLGPDAPAQNLALAAAMAVQHALSEADPAGFGWFIAKSPADNVTRLVTYRRIPKYPLLVTVGLDLDAVMTSDRTHAGLFVALGALGSLLVAGLTLLLVREIWRRTEREVELALERDRLKAARVQVGEERAKLANTRRELEASAERAEAASRAKSQFLAHMSHELRTPLHAIIGFSELIKEQASRLLGAPAIVAHADDIWSSGRHLLELINAILDISKVEAGKVTLSESLVSPGDVIRSSLVATRTQAQARGIMVDVQASRSLPMVRADPTRLRQVLINLLSNAIKFTQETGCVSVAVTDEPDGGIVLTVADNGIGMSEAEIAIALQPFGQVENTLSRSFNGTGLGLPLARRLIELHGGELRLSSVKGEGTEVSVRLPPCRVMRTGDQEAETAG